MSIANPVTWNNMCAEFGLNPNTAVFPGNFYGKGGAPGSGTLGFQDFVGRSGGLGLTYSPAAGTYSNEQTGAASYTITCNQSVVWTWTRTSGTGGAITDQNDAAFTSGGSATSLTVSISGTTTITRSATFSITSGGNTWNITVTGDQTGSTCVTIGTPILMADGTEKPAGMLVVGDVIWTRHERTLKWGAFTVSAIEFARDAVFENAGYPLATGRHRFALPVPLARVLPGRMRWWRAGWFGKPAGLATVAKITVEGAHTYMAKAPNGAWRLSHNVKQ